MDPARWQRLSPWLDQLLALDAAGQARHLGELRATDAALADELEALLALDAAADGFLDRPAVAALAALRPGMRVGPYALERMLGEGGMGQVWLAHRADGLYERRVALKLLRPGIVDPALELRFSHERQIHARLEHPHIAHLLDAGISTAGQPYLALDYVDGAPITDWCRARRLPARRRIRLFLQVCAAVSHAHAGLVVHLDLKPSNILVTDEGNVRLLDFGIAQLLDPHGQVPGGTRGDPRAFTLHYAAPEQIRGEPVTTMTDIYMLGMVLHELLSGGRPYQPVDDGADAWAQAVAEQAPLSPSRVLQRDGAGLDPAMRRRMIRAVDGDLDTIVLRALARRPQDRYGSVEALARDLRCWLDGKPVQARPRHLGERLRRSLVRHRRAIAGTAVVALSLAGALVLVRWQAGQALADAERAQAMQAFVVDLVTRPAAPLAGAVDLRAMLEAAQQRGEARLARQPLAHAGLLGLIARLRLGLGDTAQAWALLQRQDAILRALPDVPASLRLQSAGDHARALRGLDRLPECVARTTPSLPTARRHARRHPRQAAALYSELGRCHRGLGGFDAARALFAEALALHEARADDTGTLESLADLALLDAAAGDPSAAVVEVDAVLARLRRNPGGGHPLAVDLLRSRCGLLQALGEPAAARASCEAAASLALELHGASHPVSIGARQQLARLDAAGAR